MLQFTNSPHSVDFSILPIRYRNWLLNISTLDLASQPFTSGNAAFCYRGIQRSTGRQIVVKMMKHMENGIDVHNFGREIAILALAEHPSIVKFIGATDAPPFCIVMEWMSGGSLYAELYKHHRLNPTQLTKIAFDVARGMRFLHSKQIVHRDLKSLNILLDDADRAKICDFGYARQDPGEFLMTRHIGTTYWVAPELVVSSASYNERVDVYSYGIVLYEICTKQLPYWDSKNKDCLRCVVMEDLRPTVPTGVPESFIDLMQRCWAKKAADRPSFQEIVDEFKTGTVFLRGADQNEIRKYCEMAIRNDEARELGLEKGSKQMGIESLVERFAKTGVPAHLRRQFCDRLALGGANSKVIAKGLSLLLDSDYGLEALSIFRGLGRNPEFPVFLVEMIRKLPTDDPAFDREVVLTACWHGAADLCMLCVDNPELSEFVMEIVANEGVDEGL
jgi:hypothetical protein